MLPLAPYSAGASGYSRSAKASMRSRAPAEAHVGCEHAKDAQHNKMTDTQRIHCEPDSTSRQGDFLRCVCKLKEDKCISPVVMDLQFCRGSVCTLMLYCLDSNSEHALKTRERQRARFPYLLRLSEYHAEDE